MRFALITALALTAACYRTAAERQAEVARELAPATMDSGPPAVVRQILKLRVYADSSHRNRDPAWDLHVRELVEQANRLLAPKFATRLEVSNTRVWERNAGDDLQAALQELQGIDAGEDTSWIVGLVSAPRESTNDMHALGASVTLGRHIILRGTNDTAEFAALEAQLSEIAEFERGGVYRQRKAHKELVVFLHHLGHTMGAPHPKEPLSIMAPSYDARTSELGPLGTKIFALALSYRDQLFDTTAVADWLGKLNVILKRDVAMGDPADVARVRDLIEHPWKGRPTVAKPRQQEFDNLTKETFASAEAYVSGGQLNKAWTLANVMIEKHPDNARLLDFGCNVRASLAVTAPANAPNRGKGFSEERELCARAADASDLPTSDVLLARLDAIAGATNEALRIAREADSKLTAAAMASASAATRPSTAPSTSPPAASPPPTLTSNEHTKTAWTNLASIYALLGCVVSAERAGTIAGGDTATAIAAWSVAARRQQGLPATMNLGVTPENDCDYASILRSAREDLAVGHLKDARKQLAKGLAQFPNAPGLQVIGCELEARLGHAKEARRQCTEALASFDELVRAHQLLGFMDARAGNTNDAVAHLQRAVELDPDLESAWTDLAKLYAFAKNPTALAALQEAYKARFGHDMQIR